MTSSNRFWKSLLTWTSLLHSGMPSFLTSVEPETSTPFSSSLIRRLAGTGPLWRFASSKYHHSQSSVNNDISVVQNSQSVSCVNSPFSLQRVIKLYSKDSKRWILVGWMKLKCLLTDCQTAADRLSNLISFPVFHSFEFRYTFERTHTSVWQLQPVVLLDY